MAGTKKKSKKGSNKKGSRKGSRKASKKGSKARLSRKKTRTAQKKLPAATSKESKEEAAAVIQSLDSLTHRQRQDVAATIGQKNGEHLSGVIQELRTHPAPKVPQLENAEGFQELLPPQSTNVARHYAVHAAGLQAAVASKGGVDALLDEVRSPSQFFKQTAVKNFVAKENDDEALKQEILSAVPSVRKKLLKACVKSRKVAVLEAVAEELKAKFGVGYLAYFLHGCSSPVVRTYLDNAEMRKSTELHWDKLCQFHGEVVVQLIREEFKEADATYAANVVAHPDKHFTPPELTRCKIWVQWNSFLTSGRNRKALRNLLYKSGLSGALLKVSAEFPMYKWMDRLPFHNGLQPALPAMFECGEFEAHFWHKHALELLKHCSQTIKLDADHVLAGTIPCLTHAARLPVEAVLTFMKDLSGHQSSNSFYSNRLWSLRTAAAKAIPVTSLTFAYAQTAPRDMYEKNEEIKAIHAQLATYGKIKGGGLPGSSGWKLGTTEWEDIVDEAGGIPPAEKILSECTQTGEGHREITLAGVKLRVTMDWDKYRSASSSALERRFLSQSSMFFKFLPHWSCENVNEALGVIFGMFQKLYLEAGPPGYGRHCNWLTTLDTFSDAVFSFITQNKIPAAEIRLRGETPWENKRFPVLVEAFTTTTNLFKLQLVDAVKKKMAIQQLIDRVSLLEKIPSNEQGYVHNRADIPIVERLTACIDLTSTFSLNEELPLAVGEAFEERVCEALEIIERHKCTSRARTIKSYLELYKKHINIPSINAKLRSICSTVCVVEAMSPLQLLTILKLSVDLLQEVKPETDQALEAWSKECLTFYDKMNPIMTVAKTLKVGQAKTQYDECVELLFEAKMKLLASWKSSWRTEFPEREALLNMMTDEVTHLMRHTKVGMCFQSTDGPAELKKLWIAGTSTAEDNSFMRAIEAIIQSTENSKVSIKTVMTQWSDFRATFITGDEEIPFWRLCMLKQLGDCLQTRLRTETDEILAWDHNLLTTCFSSLKTLLPNVNKQRQRTIVFFLLDQVEALQPDYARAREQWLPWRKTVQQIYDTLLGQYVQKQFPYPDQMLPKLVLERKFKRHLMGAIYKRLVNLLTTNWRLGDEEREQNLRREWRKVVDISKTQRALVKTLRDKAKAAEPAPTEGDDVDDNDKPAVLDRKSDEFDEMLLSVLHTTKFACRDAEAGLVVTTSTEFHAFLTLHATHPDYHVNKGQAWTEECFGALEELKETLSRRHLKEKRLLLDEAIEVLNWTSKLSTLFDMYPRLQLEMFRDATSHFLELGPPVRDALSDKRQKKGERDRFDKTIETLSVSLLDSLEKYRIKAEKRSGRDARVVAHMQQLEAERKAQASKADTEAAAAEAEVAKANAVQAGKQTEELELTDATVDDFALHPELPAIQDEVAWTIARLYVSVPQLHVKLFTRLMTLAPLAKEGDFAAFFALLGKEQPLSNLDPLTELLLELGPGEENMVRWELVFDAIARMPSPGKHTASLIKLARAGSESQRLLVIQRLQPHLVNLAQSSASDLVDLLDAVHTNPTKVLPETRVEVSSLITTLFSPGSKAISLETRDKLLKFQDINTKEVRQSLTRATDSNSWPQRLAGLSDLLMTTLLCGKETQKKGMIRTLKFFAKKLKNEALENRLEGIKVLMQEHAKPVLLADAEYLPILMEMLGDCLEAQDQSSELLNEFVNLSIKALSLGARETDGAVFDFGFEVQWRLALYRLGDKKAAQEFNVKVDSCLRKRGKRREEEQDHLDLPFFSEGPEEGAFVKGWLSAYEKRVTDRYPEWQQGPAQAAPYFEPLFSMIGSNAFGIPQLQAFLTQCLDMLRAQGKRAQERSERQAASDEEEEEEEEEKPDLVGLNDTVEFFLTALKYQKVTDWDKVQPVQELMQALFLLWRFDDEEYERKEVGNSIKKVMDHLIAMSNQSEAVHKRYDRFYKERKWHQQPTLEQFAGDILDLVNLLPARPAYSKNETLETYMLALINPLFDKNKTKWRDVPLLHRYVDTLAKIVTKSEVKEHIHIAPMEQHAEEVLIKLVLMHPTDWESIPTIAALANSWLDQLDAVETKDHDGNLILDFDTQPIRVFSTIFERSRYAVSHWTDNPILCRYTERILRSRQTESVLWRWFGTLTKPVNFKTRAARQAARNKCVEQLLDISPSAIHLRVVCQHLVQHRQELLDPFLNSGKAQRGIFYEPASRRETKRTKRVKPGKGEAAPRIETAETPAVEQIDVQKTEELEVEQEKLAWLEARAAAVAEGGDEKHKEDAEIEAEFAPQFDHEDYYCVATFFGLTRLLPRQNIELGKQLLAQALNPDRALPARVRAMIRWTLLPTTTYAHVVALLQRFEEEGGSTLPVNLIEALLKGCMYNDEVVAPLHYLLNPEFLSSDRSRVAAYAVAKCTPHMRPKTFSDLLKNLLGGARNLKVTVSKEIVRLLLRHPTAEHIQMIVKQWQRPKLHRDIRIEILKAAFKFLAVSREIKHAEKGAWQILESAVTHPAVMRNVEILTAILGAQPAASTTHKAVGSNVDHTGLKKLILKPRLVEHLETFAEVRVPDRHCQRFAKQVVLVLCDRIKTVAAERQAKLDQAELTKHTDAMEAAAGETGETKVEDGKELLSPPPSSWDECSVDLDEDRKKALKAAQYQAERIKPVRGVREPQSIGVDRSDDDLAYLALASLNKWAVHDMQHDACQALFEVVSDVRKTFHINRKTDVQRVYTARWQMALDHLMAISGITAARSVPALKPAAEEGAEQGVEEDTMVHSSLPTSSLRPLRMFVVRAIDALCSAIVALPSSPPQGDPDQTRELRQALLACVNKVFNVLPTDHTDFYGEEEEKLLLAPFGKLPTLYEAITSRKVAQMKATQHLPEYPKRAGLLLHRIITTACTHPYYVSFVEGHCRVLLQQDSKETELPFGLLDLLMKAELVQDDENLPALRAQTAYLSLCRSLAMRFIPTLARIGVASDEYLATLGTFLDKALDVEAARGSFSSDSVALQVVKVLKAVCEHLPSSSSKTLLNSLLAPAFAYFPATPAASAEFKFSTPDTKTALSISMLLVLAKSRVLLHRALPERQHHVLAVMAHLHLALVPNSASAKALPNVVSSEIDTYVRSTLTLPKSVPAGFLEPIFAVGLGEETWSGDSAPLNPFYAALSLRIADNHHNLMSYTEKSMLPLLDLLLQRDLAPENENTANVAAATALLCKPLVEAEDGASGNLERDAAIVVRNKEKQRLEANNSRRANNRARAVQLIKHYKSHRLYSANVWTGITPTSKDLWQRADLANDLFIDVVNSNAKPTLPSTQLADMGWKATFLRTNFWRPSLQTHLLDQRAVHQWPKSLALLMRCATRDWADNIADAIGKFMKADAHGLALKPLTEDFVQDLKDKRQTPLDLLPEKHRTVVGEIFACAAQAAPELPFAQEVFAAGMQFDYEAFDISEADRCLELTRRLLDAWPWLVSLMLQAEGHSANVAKVLDTLARREIAREEETKRLGVTSASTQMTKWSQDLRTNSRLFRLANHLCPHWAPRQTLSPAIQEFVTMVATKSAESSVYSRIAEHLVQDGDILTAAVPDFVPVVLKKALEESDVAPTARARVGASMAECAIRVCRFLTACTDSLKATAEQHKMSVLAVLVADTSDSDSVAAIRSSLIKTLLLRAPSLLAESAPARFAAVFQTTVQGLADAGEDFTTLMSSVLAFADILSPNWQKLREVHPEVRALLMGIIQRGIQSRTHPHIHIRGVTALDRLSADEKKARNRALADAGLLKIFIDTEILPLALFGTGETDQAIVDKNTTGAVSTIVVIVDMLLEAVSTHGRSPWGSSAEAVARTLLRRTQEATRTLEKVKSVRSDAWGDCDDDDDDEEKWSGQKRPAKPVELSPQTLALAEGLLLGLPRPGCTETYRTAHRSLSHKVLDKLPALYTQRPQLVVEVVQEHAEYVALTCPDDLSAALSKWHTNIVDGLEVHRKIEDWTNWPAKMAYLAKKKAEKEARKLAKAKAKAAAEGGESQQEEGGDKDDENDEAKVVDQAEEDFSDDYSDRVVDLVVDAVRAIVTRPPGLSPLTGAVLHHALSRLALSLVKTMGSKTQKKAKSTSKGGSFGVELMWRPQLEALLNHFCQDTDPRVSSLALEVVTKQR